MAQMHSFLPAQDMPPVESLSDAACMLRLQQGDTTALEILYKRHRRWVYHHVFRMIKNASAAEDLTQEVFLRVYHARLHYQATAKFTTWLFQIAANLALNWIRDHRRDRVSATLEDAVLSPGARRALRVNLTPERILLREERQGLVREAISQLPARQRAVVVMHKFSEMDYNQIAEALGCSVSAVKSLVSRAFVALRADLAPALLQ